MGETFNARSNIVHSVEKEAVENDNNLLLT